jgi:uncharacterized protein YyaL (SSP411 family)
LAEARIPTVPLVPDDLSALPERLKHETFQLADEIQGGFGHQNRFPMAPQLSVLLELQAVAPDPRLAKFLRLTLEQMAGQGMRDQLAGGFFRYTVDPDWQIPHFEKMLYDQALNAALYLRAAEVLQWPAFRSVAQDTLDFVLQHMESPAGGFLASLSAVDARGIEGGGYLWSEEQVSRVLDAQERELAARVWGMRGAPNNEGGYLPVQAMSLEAAAGQLNMEPQEAAALLERARAKLLLARAARSLPEDSKPVAAWNGLMLSAFAAGVREFGEAYRASAERLAEFLSQRLWDGKQLHRSIGTAGWLGEASLEDYVFVAKGLADWAAVAGAPEERALALRLARSAWARFFDGGWVLTQSRLIPLRPREPALPDSPLPSPSAVLIRLTLELAGAERDAHLLDQTKAALRLSYPVAVRTPFGYAGSAWNIWVSRDRLSGGQTQPDERPDRKSGPDRSTREGS